MRSTYAGSTPARATISSTSRRSAAAVVRRSPSTSPSATSAQVAVSVAVSNASVSMHQRVVEAVVKVVVDGDPSPLLPCVREPNLGPCWWKSARSGLGPLDEHDRVVEVELEIPPLLVRHLLEAEEVEVGHRYPTGVGVAD